MTIAGQTFVGFPYTKDTEEVSVYIVSLIGNIETHTHKNKNGEHIEKYTVKILTEYS